MEESTKKARIRFFVDNVVHAVFPGRVFFLRLERLFILLVSPLGRGNNGMLRSGRKMIPGFCGRD